jgi:hypothetical protein
MGAAAERAMSSMMMLLMNARAQETENGRGGWMEINRSC